MLRTDNTPPPSPTSRWLVSTDWLAERLRDPSIIASSTLHIFCRRRSATPKPNTAAAISPARYFSISRRSAITRPICRTCCRDRPNSARSSATLGIGDGDTVVVYDSIGLFSAARVWWTFRLFGAKSVYILDGGLPKWKAEGRPIETGETKRTPKTFTAQMNVGAVAMLDDVRMAVTDDGVQIVDARSAERFAGKAPEPRPGLRSGHIPRFLQCALRPADRERPAGLARACRGSVHVGRRRSRQADHHQLRLRRHRSDPDFRAGIARQGTTGSV